MGLGSWPFGKVSLCSGWAGNFPRFSVTRIPRLLEEAGQDGMGVGSGLVEFSRSNTPHHGARDQ